MSLAESIGLLRRGISTSQNLRTEKIIGDVDECPQQDSKRLSLKLTASVVQWPKFLATNPEARVRFPTLPDFLRSSVSGAEFTQPRDYN
jgi:hypothetical protein